MTTTPLQAYRRNLGAKKEQVNAAGVPIMEWTKWLLNIEEWSSDMWCKRDKRGRSILLTRMQSDSD